MSHSPKQAQSTRTRRKQKKTLTFNQRTNLWIAIGTIILALVGTITLILSLHPFGIGITLPNVVQSSPVTPFSSPTFTPSTPMKTLQTLCDATKAEDYITQWDQDDPGFRSYEWPGGYVEFKNGLMTRDKNNDGVANCTFTNPVQNGSSASSTVTITFKNGATDTKTFQLEKSDVDGVWRITGFWLFWSKQPYHEAIYPCIGYLGYPFQNKQGKSCLENFACDVDKEDKIGGVVIITSLL